MSIDCRNEAVELTAALRWSARLGLNEGIDNHYSLEVDRDKGIYLVNPYGMQWSEVVASDMLLINEAGDVVQGRHPVSPTAYFIHTQVHKVRPDLKCIMHTHMPYASALTCLPDFSFHMIHQNCTRFFGEIAYDRGGFNGLAFDIGEGARIASAMQGKRILFLGNHGVIVGAESIRHAFDDLYYIERSCQLLILALSCTSRPSVISDAVAKKTQAQLRGGRDNAVGIHYDSILRVLRASEPGFEQ